MQAKTTCFKLNALLLMMHVDRNRLTKEYVLAAFILVFRELCLLVLAYCLHVPASCSQNTGCFVVFFAKWATFLHLAATRTLTSINEGTTYHWTEPNFGYQHQY